MRTLTCDRCHKDTDHLNPVYDDSGERSVILDWCDTCRKYAARKCEGCGALAVGEQQVWLSLRGGTIFVMRCLACRRPDPTDEGARLRNAMREARTEIERLLNRYGISLTAADVVHARNALSILSNALEGDADNANP